MNLPIGLNLFTVREEANKDFIETIEKVKNIGFDYVEVSGLNKVEIGTIKRGLKIAGLPAIGYHSTYQSMEENLDDEIKKCIELGCSYFVCSWSTFRSKEEYIKAASFLNEVGKRLFGYNIELLYHGHDFDFTEFDGEHGQRILYNHTDAKYLKNEIDVYWVKYVNLDPLKNILEYKDRCPILHLKDMKDEISKEFTEIGKGIIDIKGCIEQGILAGSKYFVLEQDLCKMPPLESIAISYENLKKIIAGIDV